MERLTGQRRILREVFRLAERPLSPLEALTRARQLDANLGVATVYRTVKALLEVGELVIVPLASGARYERGDKAPHAHFHCRECDRLYDVSGDKPELSAPQGFRLETQEIVLYGVCSSCTDQEA